MNLLKLFVGSYLLGAIPFAYLAARIARGIDIRRVGSRNAGATNVTLRAGVVPGLITALGDAGKGMLAVWWAGSHFADVPAAPLVALLAAMAGHNWSIWLRFEGGGGLATFVGGMVLIGWVTVAVLIPFWGLSYAITRHKYLSAVLACTALPVVVGAYLSSWQHFYFGLGAAVLLGLKQVRAWARLAAGPMEESGNPA